MPDRPSRDGRTSESTESAASTAANVNDPVDDPVDGSTDSHVDGSTDSHVDEAVKRRLREAYLNDEERVLIVTGVRSVGSTVVVELEPPHGGTTHTERFAAPRDGSLSESAAFLEFLAAAGVSPLDVDELVGTRIPATYDPETGWRLDEAYATDRADESADAAPRDRAADWVWTNRYWLLAVLLVGGELLFVAVIIVLFA
ncbi:hypothetical protein C461_08229 [Halorubrum aidingense JCM 13560]|uniref:Uncharacterized protein n=1 Tax=Halorubrum aidingense JCM 13560 TaxID=1230454 RepID=M0PDT1_9EURY|nr:hypothetical protein [Halorubrum aidingense]EMA67699.1 hypothetical protein C461_08229 [Halorubrum aidingense JCM 13560]